MKTIPDTRFLPPDMKTGVAACIVTWMIHLIIADKHPGTITVLPGAVDELRGTVFPINSYVEIKIITRPLMDLQTTLHEHLHQLRVLKLRVNTYPFNEKHKSMLLQEVDRLNNRISGYVASNWPNSTATRTKRGAFNFVGVMSNYLFGTVDEKTFNTRLQDLGGKIDAVASTFNTQTDAIEKLDINVKRLATAMTKIINNTAHEDSTDEFAQLAFFLAQHAQEFTAIQNDMTQLQTAMSAAIHGTVTPSLLSPRDVRKIVKTVRMKHDKSPLFTTRNITLFYASLSSYLTVDGLSILLPLRPRVTLQAHRIHPFPHLQNNTLVTLVAPHLILRSSPDEFSPAQAMAFPPQALEDTCLNPAHGIYLCMTPAWPYITNTSSCAHALFSHQHRIFEACTFKIYNPTPSPFILPLQSASLIYFFKPTPVTVNCPDTIPMDPLTGPFILPHKCAILTMTFNLPAIKHYVTSVSTSLQFQHPMSLPPFDNSQNNRTINMTLLNIPNIAHIPYTPTLRPLFSFGYPILITLMGMTITAVAALTLIFYARRDTPTNTTDPTPKVYPDLNTLNIKISTDEEKNSTHN